MASRKPKKAERATAVRQKRVEVRTVEPETIEEVKGGMGIEDGIVLTTTVLLIGALVLAWLAMGEFPA